MVYAVNDFSGVKQKFDIIGWEMVSEIIKDSVQNVEIVFLRNRNGNNVLLELVTPMTDHSPVTRTIHMMKGVSTPYHICYEVNSLEKGIEKLKRQGFCLAVKPMPAIAFDNRRVVFMVSKETGLIELLERERSNE